MIEKRISPVVASLWFATLFASTQSLSSQAVATYFNRNIDSEAAGRIAQFAAAGHRVVCVAFPPAGGNRFSIVTDKTFENRGVPSELHAKMVSLVNAGHKIRCVAFPPAGGNRWSLITDKTFSNRNVPAELHTKMNDLRNAGHQLTWVAFPPAGGNSWSLLTNKAFSNRNVPAELHSRMQTMINAGERPTCVAFPMAGGNRWSVVTDKGTFFNRNVPSYIHRVMNDMLRVPGGPIACVAYDPDKFGFTVASTASPYGRPPTPISTNTETFSIDLFASRLQKKLFGTGVKYGFVIRHGDTIRSHHAGAKRTVYSAPAQKFTIYDRFNPASISKTVTAVAVLRALQKRRLGVDEKIYKFLPSFWTIPASVKTISFKELLNHTSGFRLSGTFFNYDQLRGMVAAGVGSKAYEYENSNYALARIVCVYLDNYQEAGVTNHSLKTSQHFEDFVQQYVASPSSAVDVVWRPDVFWPTRCYPFPAGTSTGTTYGDFSLAAGPAGCHMSLAEYSQFLDRLSNSTKLLSANMRQTMDANLLGWFGTKAVKHGSYITKGGDFPPGPNGGAELHTRLAKFDNGILVAAMVNGPGKLEDYIRDAYNEAWQPKSIKLSSLTASTYSVSKNTLKATGSNLHLATRVQFGTTSISSRSPGNPITGYFKVINATSAEIYPPQGINGGDYAVSFSNSITTSNAQMVTVRLPRTPTMVCTPTPQAGQNFAAVVAKAQVTAPHCWLSLSPSNKPSVLPNIFNFGIGDSFSLLFFWPVAQRFHRTTAATTFTLPSLAILKGETWYFQALFATASLPLPVSNVEPVKFQ